MDTQKHAKLGASGAHAWMACPGKPNAEATLPKEQLKGSAYAMEGTAAHFLLENCILAPVEPKHYLGAVIGIDAEEDAFWLGDSNKDKAIQSFPVDDEMVDNIQQCLDKLNEIAPIEQWEAETRVDFSHAVPKGFGTTDAWVIVGDTLYIRDLKYGKGVRVDSPGNPQNRLYGVGALNDIGYLYDVEKIDMGILQPRMDHHDNEVLTTQELDEWVEHTVKPAAHLASQPDAPRVPGEKQCRFCAFAGQCPELAQHNINTCTGEIDNVDDTVTKIDNLSKDNPLPLIDVQKLEVEQVAKLLTQAAMIDSWIRSLEGVVIDAIKSGIPAEGWKLVEGRSIRKWEDEEVAEKFLRRTRKLKQDEAFTRKLISPAQAEKKLGKTDKRLQQLIIKPEGEPTLAPATDKRKALVFNQIEDMTQGELLEEDYLA